eukprot:scaffold87998_cov17-Tisochrysis_lutea.AAC.1
METWLWFQPPEWRTAREAGIQPPLPKAIELLNRQCGIDTSEADAHEVSSVQTRCLLKEIDVVDEVSSRSLWPRQKGDVRPVCVHSWKLDRQHALCAALACKERGPQLRITLVPSGSSR